MATSIKADAILQKRKARLKAKMIRQGLTMFLITAFISFLVWSVAYSPFFKISEVSVVGLSGHSFPIFVKESDFDKIESELKSQTNTSLIVFNENALAKQISKQFVSLKDVRVAKNWPNKVVIIVEPRQPEANYGGFLIDADGVELGPMSEDGAYPSLEISNPSLKADCLQILRSATDAGLSSSKVTATTNDDIAIVLKNGNQIVFGNTNKMTLKLSDVSAILNTDKMDGHTVLDVSAPTAPVVR